MSHPGVARSGGSLGLAWRFAPDGSATGGALYVQDVVKGTDSADPGSQPIAINQDSGHIFDVGYFDVGYSVPSYGPSVASEAKVNIVVAEHSGDINVYDDRGGAGTFKAEDRLQSGTISVPYGYLSWTLGSNVVTQKATFTVNSGKSDHSTYSIADRYLNASPGDPGYVADINASPGDPGYVADSNPIIGLEVSDSGNDSGGPDFIAWVDPTVKGDIKIVTTGGATFRNSTGF